MKVLLWSIPYWTVVVFLYLIGADHRLLLTLIVASCILLLILMIALIRGNKHHFFSVEKDSVSWQQHLVNPHRRYSKNAYHRLQLSNITVKNIRKVVLKQTVVERCFNIGRIAFEADIDSISVENGWDYSVDAPKPPYEFAGVKSFRRFKEYLYQQLPPSAFIAK
ncbi:MAG: hypothetical protein IJX76_00225 [Clostridia bacterium]|nr:hypothetical protein [Clostridia bacterium]